jgi:hypothetical protein
MVGRLIHRRAADRWSSTATPWRIQPLQDKGGHLDLIMKGGRIVVDWL